MAAGAFATGLFFGAKISSNNVNRRLNEAVRVENQHFEITQACFREALIKGTKPSIPYFSALLERNDKFETSYTVVPYY